MATTIRFIIDIAFWFWFYDQWEKKYGKFPCTKHLIMLIGSKVLIETFIRTFMIYMWGK